MSIRKLMIFASLALGVAMLIASSALAKAGATQLPMTGTQSGEVTTNLATGAFSGEDVGVATHFGRYVNDYQGTINLATGAFTGTFTVVAANGDEAYGTISGQASNFTPEGHTSTETITFTGGTGRFADTTGTATETSVSTTLSSSGSELVSATHRTFTGQINLFGP